MTKNYRYIVVTSKYDIISTMQVIKSFNKIENAIKFCKYFERIRKKPCPIKLPIFKLQIMKRLPGVPLHERGGSFFYGAKYYQDILY